MRDDYDVRRGKRVEESEGFQPQYLAMLPASTRRSRPVIIFASSDARKTAAFA
jgi:hypothetical protein